MSGIADVCPKPRRAGMLQRRVQHVDRRVLRVEDFRFQCELNYPFIKRLEQIRGTSQPRIFPNHNISDRRSLILELNHRA